VPHKGAGIFSWSSVKKTQFVPERSINEIMICLRLHPDSIGTIMSESLFDQAIQTQPKGFREREAEVVGGGLTDGLSRAGAQTWSDIQAGASNLYEAPLATTGTYLKNHWHEAGVGAAITFLNPRKWVMSLPVAYSMKGLITNTALAAWYAKDSDANPADLRARYGQSDPHSEAVLTRLRVARKSHRPQRAQGLSAKRRRHRQLRADSPLFEAESRLGRDCPRHCAPLAGHTPVSERVARFHHQRACASDCHREVEAQISLLSGQTGAQRQINAKNPGKSPKTAACGLDSFRERL
jgi:hypothetical protein